jgi:predicted O-methyltransferase YrrM
VGKLLATLVASCPGGRFAEHGTGIGIGTAWMASAMSPNSTLVSAEIDPTLAAAASELFRDLSNVEIRTGDCSEVLAGEPPFDLVFVDAGARDSLQPQNWDRITEWVRIGGLIVFDDLKPIELCPPEWHDRVDRKREFAFHNPRILGAEIRTTPTEAALVIARLR